MLVIFDDICVGANGPTSLPLLEVKNRGRPINDYHGFCTPKPGVPLVLP